MKAIEFLLLQRKAFFEGTEMVVSGIKKEMFDTRPFPQLMSFGEQVDHLSAVEADMLDEAASALKLKKIPFDFKRSENIRAGVGQWKRIHDLGDQFIAGLDEDQLGFRFLSVSHVHVSVAGMINSVIEHEVHHRGELVAYFKMLDLKPSRPWSN